MEEGHRTALDRMERHGVLVLPASQLTTVRPEIDRTLLAQLRADQPPDGDLPVIVEDPTA